MCNTSIQLYQPLLLLLLTLLLPLPPLQYRSFDTNVPYNHLIPKKKPLFLPDQVYYMYTTIRTSPTLLLLTLLLPFPPQQFQSFDTISPYNHLIPLKKPLSWPDHVYYIQLYQPLLHKYGFPRGIHAVDTSNITIIKMVVTRTYMLYMSSLS